MDVNIGSGATPERFMEWYARFGAAAPSQEQWRAILSRPADQPFTLINFFKFFERAAYADGAEAASGEEAFARYAAVSGPALERAGGRFLHVGPFVGAMLGAAEDWDLVAIGAYPDLSAFTRLYADPAYRAAFAHRVAACERQKVLIAG